MAYTAIHDSTAHIRFVAIDDRTRDRGSRLATLSRREHEVLALMASGRTNNAIAARLVVSAGAVEKHIASIFTKLDLRPSPDDHRRVLAVLAYVASR